MFTHGSAGTLDVSVTQLFVGAAERSLEWWHFIFRRYQES
ncbi:hypothetical protein AtDm6_0608 [Acetobacter tropicalis]|uniref:Uncharacterized protein n=1 Tax=Acetobacter tropicalis TaxID=104102 RepID=A0A095B9G0_9PROT|nr:hypothetical protein AtDm6_0608 [Acetobacter tropicalis]